jgi:integrase
MNALCLENGDGCTGPAVFAACLEAAHGKRRQTDTVELRADTAPELRTFLAKKAPASPAFTLPRPEQVVKTLRADLEAAGIPYRDDVGRVADFHAVRHTFITNLANSGVRPKVAQALAGHATVTSTLDRYSHSYIGE